MDVEQAMRSVHRRRFIPEEYLDHAEGDYPLPIGRGQTISQPSLVAEMIRLLDVRPDHTVLEVGAGSGWVAAILSKLCRQVIAIERMHDLASAATGRLEPYSNVRVIEGDGKKGYPPLAPYERILVSAAASSVPPALIEQLKDDGILVIPVGDEREQWVRVITKNANAINERKVIPVRFVPLR